MRRWLMLLLAVAACSGDEGNEPNVPVATVMVAPSTSSILVGSEMQLQATTLDANGGTLSGRQITWATSDPTSATVSSSGVVTGVAEGDATVTACRDQDRIGGRDGTGPRPGATTGGGNPAHRRDFQLRHP